MKYSSLILLTFFSCWQLQVQAQGKATFKFGKIAASDFNITSPVVDSNSHAVIIADVGTCEFKGNEKGWFTLVFNETKRIKILDKSGYNAANIEIDLYKYGEDAEKITDIKAVTYNLENGAVSTAKLDDKSIFQTELSKNILAKKFTFPAVKEGSIIEYSYKIESDFLFSLHSWEFQSEYPCLWSSYEVKVPAIFNYTILKQGATNYFINTTDEKSQVFNIKENSGTDAPYGGVEKVYAVNTSVTIKNWVMKDVPAMDEQDYTSTIENYISKLEFQLSEYRFPDEPVKSELKDWNMVSEEMLKYEDFGKAITEDNGWVTDELKNISLEGKNENQKAREVYEYVRNNYSCTKDYGIFLSENTTFKDIIKKKSGSVSDINLLLITMLRKSGLSADPVILSTREHGVVNAQYPMMEKFNYVICDVKINGISYFLDATNPYLGFGRLESKCYNGMARIINDQPSAVYLNADDLHENKTCNIKLTNSVEGSNGECIELLGYNQSLQLRQKLFANKQDEFVMDEEKKYAEDVKIKDLSFDSLKQDNFPVTVKYEFTIRKKDDDVIYFNPMMSEIIKENPFKSENRLYPVELPFALNENYSFSMDIPQGYIIEELPKSQSFTMPDNKGKFEYNISQSLNSIQLRTRLQLNKTFFDVSDYEMLREFYAEVIKKQSEQIVFKKSK